MITSLIYLGIFQIIFHNTIDPLPVATKKPMLKCTEGKDAEKNLFKKTNNMGPKWSISPHNFTTFFEKPIIYFLFNSFSLSLYKTVQKSLEQV